MTKKITLEDLATMVAEGFTEMRTHFDGLFNGLDGQIVSLKGQVSGINGQIVDLKQEVQRNTDSIERIDLRLQQVAYQSDYRELEERVTKLEHRVRVR